HDVLELYQTALDNLQKDPQNERLKETVRMEFVAANGYITGSLPLFRVDEYQVPMLVTYAQAANLHLLLLRDVVAFGKSWGLESYTVEGFEKDLKKRIWEYTD
ncbi:insecticidal delta-endotoxin Cry8Ea1 family protein, partial [Bacillus cereus]|uniref:insecticidal delta-endotoxin Cry8Ea1 family protein n=1 Tax=Bacillus cereus TaxID=1396 RepID=UPI001F0AA4F0